MSEGPRDLPALPQDPKKLDPSVRQPLEQQRSAVQTLIGTRGDPLDQAITLRMGQKLGFITNGRKFAIGTSSIIGTGTGANPFDPEPDLTPPPTVGNLTATAGFSQIIVQWAAATYLQGHGHQQTNIYAVKKDANDPTQPTFSDAQRVEEATGELTIVSLPSDLGIRWHVWAKYQTVDGVESVDPAGGVNGVIAQTGLIGGANLAPLAVTAAALADGAVDLMSAKIKSFDQFGALAVGYTVTQYLLAKSGVMQNLVVDDAQIARLSASKLTVGDGSVGGNLKSSGYVTGTQGWIVRPDGYSEFSNGVFRGGVFATYGVFAGSLAAATGTFAGALTAATGTFAGALSAATGTFTGNLSAVGGTFTGNLVGVNGTFSGTLTAANVVTTGNIAPNAVSNNVAASSSASGSLRTGDSVQILSAVINCDASFAAIGANVSIIANVNLSAAISISDTSNATAYIYRNDAILKNVTVTATLGNPDPTNSSSSSNSAAVTFIANDSPGPGLWTYKVVVNCTGGANATAGWGAPSILLLGSKR